MAQHRRATVARRAPFLYSKLYIRINRIPFLGYQSTHFSVHTQLALFYYHCILCICLPPKGLLPLSDCVCSSGDGSAPTLCHKQIHIRDTSYLLNISTHKELYYTLFETLHTLSQTTITATTEVRQCSNQSLPRENKCQRCIQMFYKCLTAVKLYIN